MGKGFFQVPTAINEPIKSYAPGSPERKEVLEQYKTFFNGNDRYSILYRKQGNKNGQNKTYVSPP